MFIGFIIYCLYSRQQTKIRISNDYHFRHVDTDADHILLKFSDCTCTNHYVKTLSGVKSVLLYEEIAWIHEDYHSMFIRKIPRYNNMSLAIVVHTLDGKSYKIINTTQNKKNMNIINQFDKFLKEKNPHCLFKNYDENKELYLKRVK